MEAGLEVVVVMSRAVKAFRERYSSSGSKSNRGDAYVLADCLRTDRHRWPSLQPDTPATVTLRSHVRARRDLVDTRIAVANQLRAHLLINFPGAVGLFSDLDGHVSRLFLRRFTTENQATWLTERRLENWPRSATGTRAGQRRASRGALGARENEQRRKRPGDDQRR
jgi:transposase